MPKKQWMRFWTPVVVVAATTVMAACVQPTGSSGDGGAGSGGGSNQTPGVPPVDDYATLFVSQGSQLPGTGGAGRVGRGSVSIADFDNDGDLDVLLAGEEDPRIAELYLNDGSGSFTSADAGFTAVGEYAATTVGDVNGDDTIDVFISGDESNSVDSAKLYTNEISAGQPVFTEASAAFDSPLLEQGPAQLFDADGDNDLDLLLGGLNGNFGDTRLYVNQGPTNEGDFDLSTAGNLSSVSWRGSMALADFDGENGLDVVLTGNGGSTALINNGSGSFAATASPVAESGWWTGLSAGDIDGNGTVDLVVTGSGTSNAASLYANDGDATFADVTASQASEFMSIREGASAFGDIDLDGDLDLFISGTESAVGLPASGSIRLYLNDGDGNFSLQDTGSSVSGTLRGNINLFDVDGDTDLDLLVTGLRGTTPSAILHINTLFN